MSIYSKFDVINLAAEKTYDDLEVRNMNIEIQKLKWKKICINALMIFRLH